jgi:hypothetical protein
MTIHVPWGDQPENGQPTEVPLQVQMYRWKQGAPVWAGSEAAPALDPDAEPRLPRSLATLDHRIAHGAVVRNCKARYLKR